MIPVFVHGISQVLGEPRPIEELTVLRDDPARLDAFRSMGFVRYRRASMSAAQLGVAAIAKLIEEFAIDPANIDVLLYCSNSLTDPAYYHVFHRALTQMGLANAFPIGLHFTFCGNFGSGVRVALAMLMAAEARSVLVLCADKGAERDDSKRLYEPAVAVTSDGAACCLLSTREGGRLQVHGTSQLVNHAMSVLSVDDLSLPGKTRSPEFMWYSLASMRGRKQACERALQRFGLTPPDVAGLITNNYGENTAKGFASETGIPLDRVFRDNVAENGHVHTADVLINLKTLMERRRPPIRTTLLLLSTGPYSWGFTAVETV
jgi:3-oxoacyl-[acyl-carrier-protein] synthase-3